MDHSVRENWENLQEKFNFPVDAIGRPIDALDEETLTVWHSEGIDQFLAE